MLGISDAAESIGLRTQGVRIGLEQLIEAAPLPCILHWNQNHFVVLYAIKRRSVFSKKKKYNINLVFQIRLKVNTKLIKSDLKCWISTREGGKDSGIALLLTPTPDFCERIDDQEQQKRNLSFYLRYLFPYKSQLIQLTVGMMLGSVFSLIFPFLTQAVVDQGIGNSNLSFITLILIAQMILSITQMG